MVETSGSEVKTSGSEVGSYLESNVEARWKLVESSGKTKVTWKTKATHVRLLESR